MRNITLLLLIIGLASCGGIPRSKIQNLPTLIDLADINFESGQFKLRINHRHKKPSTLNTLSCQIAFQDIGEHQFKLLSVPDLSSFAKETINIHSDALKLSNHPLLLGSINYVLDCYLESEEFATEHIISKSILYRVPGEKSSYR